MDRLTPRVNPLDDYDGYMCMFSRHVEHVSATKIFASGLPDGRQSLVYAMSVAVGEPLAMVLPLPVPAGGPDNAVEFVSLERYPTLFDDLKRAFPTTGFLQGAPLSRASNRPEKSMLKVHAVGAFEASYVPHPRDFDRLDPRFRLPPSVLKALPLYADWGFAVFQLAPTKHTPFHPMALTFPRREPDSIFFPTTHVHDGALPATAQFDHSLYAQFPPMVALLSNWTPSVGTLGANVDATKAQGLFDPATGGHMSTIHGEFPNGDVWLAPPTDVSLDDMSGRGDTYAYRVNATYFYAKQSHHMYPKWRDTTANKLPALCRGIREALAELAARNARSWQLGPITEERPHFMNGDQLWSGTDYMNGKHVAEPSGAGHVRFRPFGTLVEQQDIELGFVALPSQDDARDINRALCAMLDRIASEAS